MWFWGGLKNHLFTGGVQIHDFIGSWLLEVSGKWWHNSSVLFQTQNLIVYVRAVYALNVVNTCKTFSQNADRSIGTAYTNVMSDEERMWETDYHLFFYNGNDSIRLRINSDIFLRKNKFFIISFEIFLLNMTSSYSHPFYFRIFF